MNQEESEQHEVNEMKKGVDSTGKVMHIYIYGGGEYLRRKK